MNSSPILRIIGIVMMVFGIGMLFPLLLAISNTDYNSRNAFAASFCISVFLGVLLFLSTRGRSLNFGRRETAVAVILLCIVTTIIGALPLYLSDGNWRLFDACFESLSGLTTTGLSMTNDPSLMTDSILLWRAMLQWMGGYGSLLLVIWALPSFGFGGTFLPRRDAVEVIAADRQLSFQQLWRSLFLVYLILTTVCVLTLKVCGMPLLEALCYSMTTISTGGFMLDSAGPFGGSGNSTKIVLSIFMILGAINFTLHIRFLSRDWRVYDRDREVRLLFCFILIAMTLVLLFSGAAPNSMSVIDGMLFFISVMTTTGFPINDISTPEKNFFIFIAIFLAIIGGTSGSTSGGIRTMRLTLLFHHARKELFQLIHPHAVVPVKFGRFSVTTSFVQIVWVFFFCYLCSLIVLTTIFSVFSIEFSSALLLAVTVLSNSGPALINLSSPELHQWLQLDWIKLTAMIGMLLGRLEFLILLVLFNFSFWKP